MAILNQIYRSLRRRAGQVIRAVPAWYRFWRSYLRYRAIAPPDKRPSLRTLYPCVYDVTDETPVDPVYYYQDAWAFERIVNLHPEMHVDVGSHHKYVSLLSRVVPVTMVDIRPLPTPLEGLTFRRGSILALPFADRSLPSLSSLCVVEHIGLGRYGDNLDPEGTEKALAELVRVVRRGGSLFISVPLDDANGVQFNAQRVFEESYILRQLEPLEVVERRYIYGREFVDHIRDGFGVGCYHLCRSSEE